MPNTIISSAKAAALVIELQDIGDRLETAASQPGADRGDWLVVARAAAMIESLRLGLACIGVEVDPIWQDACRPPMHNPVSGGLSC